MLFLTEDALYSVIRVIPEIAVTVPVVIVMVVVVVVVIVIVVGVVVIVVIVIVMVVVAIVIIVIVVMTVVVMMIVIVVMIVVVIGIVTTMVQIVNDLVARIVISQDTHQTLTIPWYLKDQKGLSIPQGLRSPMVVVQAEVLAAVPLSLPRIDRDQGQAVGTATTML